MSDGLRPPTMARKIGDLAEDFVLQYLRKKGLKLVVRNYLCRVGEIDLVMRDGAQLVFVEVRCRKTAMFGSGVESVGWSKQLKLIRTARCYMSQHRLNENTQCRFDVVGVVFCQGLETADITWIQNAFEVQ